jgi:acetyl esterase/lipase
MARTGWPLLLALLACGRSAPPASNTAPVSSSAVAAPPSTTTPPPLISPAELATLTAPPPDHRIPYGTAPQQFGNLRLPKSAGPHPVVILIHGGCWLAQYDVAYLAAAEQALADSGYAVWSLEYRRVGDEGGGWPGTFADIARGADLLRELAPKYALDLTRVVAAGHSAGGQLALWLAARDKMPAKSELYAASPLHVGGVLALAPAADLETLQAEGVCGGVVGKLLGGSPAERPERYGAVSPMQLAPIGVPQTVIVGARDEDWSPGGRSYFARARAAGDDRIELVVAPEAGHFELVAPATSTWPIVLEGVRGLLGKMGR